ncbi:MAG: hypothetical protein CXR31_13300 [Geobacter sp.]|nr:MAG: hypothetical protein CXR31_13300 [Geobacter sp.]
MSRTSMPRPLVLALAVWGAGIIAGCTSLPVSGSQAANLSVTALTRVAPTAPWCVNPADSSIAMGDNGLQLFEPAAGTRIRLATPSPTALAWSPDGKRLAAALPDGDSTTLAIFSRQGKPIAQAPVPGRVTGIEWMSSADLVALGVGIRIFSFGDAITATLYRWDGTSAPQSTTLFETTVKPLTVRQWGERIITSISMAISSDRDEMLYTRLHDPPAFSPYLRIILRNLESGAERDVATTAALSSGGGRFVGTGDRIVYGDGSSLSRVMAPWSDKVIQSFLAPGKQLAASPAGEDLLLDGHLYQGETEIASFPPASDGSFAPGGTLYIRHDTAIYRIGGLTEAIPAPLQPAVAERLRTMRAWRSEGLISDREYRENKKRIMEP